MNQGTVVESSMKNGNQPQEIAMTMVKITIRDVGTCASYELRGRNLKMTQTGGCCDALTNNHCDISARMSDEKIRRRVYDAWCIGYDGDPEAANLTVVVERV